VRENQGAHDFRIHHPSPMTSNEAMTTEISMNCMKRL